MKSCCSNPDFPFGKSCSFTPSVNSWGVCIRPSNYMQLAYRPNLKIFIHSVHIVEVVVQQLTLSFCQTAKPLVFLVIIIYFDSS